MKKKLIIFLISICFLFFNFGFSVRAEEGKAKVPETIEGGIQMVKTMIKAGSVQLPQNIKTMWQDDVLPVWGKMYAWFKDNIGDWVREKIRQREPAVKKSFELEKGEMAQDIKKEAPKISEHLKYFWQEIKKLFNNN